MRIYRIIAVVTGGFGALLGLGVVALVIGAAFGGQTNGALLAFALLAVVGIVAVSFVSSAIVHLRRPSRKSALTLASNFAVLIWITFNRLLAATNFKDWVGPAYAWAAIILAYIIYRLLFKPLAIRVFPSDDKVA